MRRTLMQPADFFFTGLQAGINRLLAHDIETRNRLAQLEGRVIAIEVTGPGLQVYLLPGGEGLELARERPPQVNVTICGRPAALLGMVTRGSDARSQGHVEIRGDIHLAQQLQEIMKSVDLDWEEFVSQYTGDMAAHHIGRIGRDIGRYFSMTGRRLADQLSEYLRYEQDMLPLRTDIDRFIEEVDALRDDVERMQQRLNRIERRWEDRS